MAGTITGTLERIQTQMGRPQMVEIVLTCTADAAAATGLEKELVLVGSTGVVGWQLPMEKIAAGIADAARALSPDGGHDAALAIMTTDTRPKEIAVEFQTSRVRRARPPQGKTCSADSKAMNPFLSASRHSSSGAQAPAKLLSSSVRMASPSLRGGPPRAASFRMLSPAVMGPP